MTGESAAAVGIIMGSRSDWETMRHAVDVLNRFAVPHEAAIVSAHRTPQWMAEFASTTFSLLRAPIMATSAFAWRLRACVGPTFMSRRDEWPYGSP